MPRLAGLLLPTLFVLAGSSQATDVSPKPQSTESFDVSKRAGFTAWRSEVLRFVSEHRPGAAAHLCVFGERRGDDAWVWVIWREGHKLILWDGGDSSLDESRRLLDERRDVVATDDEINGSDYLVTRAWVANLKSRCARDGTSVAFTAAQTRPHPVRH